MSKSKLQLIPKLAQPWHLAFLESILTGNQQGWFIAQAKRTNVGIALITSPRVLFLDEPTSGLDSFTANEVMAVVKMLVGFLCPFK